MEYLIKPNTSGSLFDASLDSYPSIMWGLVGKEDFSSTHKTSHYFGYVYEGEFVLSHESGFSIKLGAGQFFSQPGAIQLQGDGKAVVFERFGYRGLFYISGAIESTGRLAYIDNCSVTQIFPPPRSGDPTLQALFFPPNTEQTMHCHPTLRFGFVVRGKGLCVLPGSKVPLEKGMVFNLPPMTPHCFHSSTEGLMVIAFHPDSEDGPDDHKHPMLSRTYIESK